MGQHDKTFDSFGNKWCNIGNHYVAPDKFAGGKYQCKECRRNKATPMPDTPVTDELIDRRVDLYEDAGTRERMNRDSLLKNLTKDMSDEVLTEYIRLKVLDELESIQIKRHLNNIK